MICYVILHYQDLDITRKCINVLLQNNQKSPIIIVDNCSPNGSGLILKKEYYNEERVTVICNNQNQGFACGNNIGFSFAKKEFNPNIIVVMNNDIIIDDLSFERKIEECFRLKEVDVLGPDIITPLGNHQNPLAYHTLSSKYIRRRIKVDKIKIHFLKWDIFFKIYMFYKKKHPVAVRKETPKEANDCILHGSCIIYGKRYIEKENLAFLPVTYMYNEESILYDYLKFKGYRIMYIPTISVLHMQGVSTSKRIMDEKKRILFRFEQQTESAEKQLLERQKYYED